MSQPPKKPKPSGSAWRKEKDRKLLSAAAAKSSPITKFLLTSKEKETAASNQAQIPSSEEPMDYLDEPSTSSTSNVVESQLVDMSLPISPPPPTSTPPPTTSTPSPPTTSTPPPTTTVSAAAPTTDPPQTQPERSAPLYDCDKSSADFSIGTHGLCEGATHLDSVSDEEFFKPCFKSKIKIDTFLKFHENISPKIQKSNLIRSNKCIRKFLTFNEESNQFHCIPCLAFCGPTDRNSFIEGSHNNTKHNTTRFDEHEKSAAHRNYVNALVMHEQQCSVTYHITKNLAQKARADILGRRQILERIVEIIKLIGKRGLSYRGDQNESASTLADENLDHGNFLEIVKLLSKFDPVLKQHVERCSAESSKRRVGSRGRGSTVTFLSKTTVNYVFEILHDLMLELISQEIKEAEIFSMQIDTCQDISVKEQLSLILRYVKDGRVFETFAGFLECSSTSGNSLLLVVENHLEKCKIDIKKCVGCATDGASNMRGQFNGFQANLSSKSAEQLHVWCFSHVLNLVLTECCKGNLTVIDLFDAISEAAKLIKYSYKRSNLFESKLDRGTLKRLHIVGLTRWWSSEKALSNIFGPIGHPEKGLYVPLILTLDLLSKDSQTDSANRSKASGILQKMLKYQAILTAHLFMQIFHVTTPLSNYLQTKGLDILQAHIMVKTACDDLLQLKEDHSNIFSQSSDFILYANSKFNEAESDLELKAEFPARRGRRRARFFDEDAVASSETLSALDIYKADVISSTYQTITSLLTEKFSKHGEIAADLHLFDPRNFDSLKNLPGDKFSKLSQKIKSYYPDFDESDLNSELQNFAINWPKFRQDVHALYEEEAKLDGGGDENDVFDIDSDEGEIDKSNNVPPFAKCGNSCFSSEGCVLCIFRHLERYNMYCMAYKNLYLVYKYILTLSIGQVECERSFSKMKYIKSRLRSSLSEANFVHITQIYCEKRLLFKLENEKVIDRLCQKSRKLSDLLSIK